MANPKLAASQNAFSCIVRDHYLSRAFPQPSGLGGISFRTIEIDIKILMLRKPLAGE
jgi:hypothetical protein